MAQVAALTPTCAPQGRGERVANRSDKPIPPYCRRLWPLKRRGRRSDGLEPSRRRKLTVRRILIQPEGVEVAARADETILQAARRAGVDLPHECGWGSCGVCKLTLVSGEIELVFPAAPAVNPRDARRGRILACQGRAISDLTIRRNPGDWVGPPIRCVEHRATLRSVEELAPEIRRFTFETEQPAAFLPGQM